MICRGIGCEYYDPSSDGNCSIGLIPNCLPFVESIELKLSNLEDLGRKFVDNFHTMYSHTDKLSLARGYIMELNELLRR